MVVHNGCSKKLQSLRLYGEHRTNGGNTCSGYVYTVDPVSNAAVLVDKKGEDGVYNVEMVMADAIKDIKVVERKFMQIDEMDALFLSKEVHMKLHSKSSNISVGHQLMSRQLIVDPTCTALRKAKLIGKLKEHRLPVQVQHDQVTVAQVVIKAPYTVEQCYSDNQIVLKKIRDIVTSIGDIVSQ